MNSPFMPVTIRPPTSGFWLCKFAGKKCRLFYSLRDNAWFDESKGGIFDKVAKSFGEDPTDAWCGKLKPFKN